MELLYLKIFKYRNLESIELNFGRDYKFQYLPIEDPKPDGFTISGDFELIAEEHNPKLPTDFWGDKISNLSLIVGENGSGKTNLVRLLIDILTFDLRDGSFFYIYRIGKNYFSSGRGPAIPADIFKMRTRNGKFAKQVISKKDGNRYPIEPVKIITYDSIYNPLYDPNDQIVSSSTHHHGNASTSYAFNKVVREIEEEELHSAYSNPQWARINSRFKNQELERQVRAYYALSKSKNKMPFAVPDTLVITLKDIEQLLPAKEYEKYPILRNLIELNYIGDTPNSTGNQKESFLMPFYKSALINFTIIFRKAFLNDDSSYSDPFSSMESKKYHMIIDKPEISYNDIYEFFEKLEAPNEKLSHIDDIIFNTRKFLKLLERFYETHSLRLFQLTDHEAKRPIIFLINKDIDPDGGYITTDEIQGFIETYFASVQYDGYLLFDWGVKDREAPLSSGQLSLLNLFSRLLMHINQEGKMHFIILDEPDLTLHPEWQRIFVNDFVGFINAFYGAEMGKVQIIITTHSPILISDVPSQNVNYLKLDKYEKTPENETFGANIHELLSHSFFMKKGLIGNFARTKINILLGRFNKVLSNNDEMEKSKIKEEQEDIFQFIALVGDEMVQAKLQEMLFEIIEEDPKEALRRYYRKRLDDLG